MSRQQRIKSFFFAFFIVAVSMFVPLSARAEMTEYPVAKLQMLDKTTARTMTFNAKVGSTVKFGTIYIRPQTCRKAPPIEKPEAAAFLQVWEVTLKEQKPAWIFSGWMFASSPALSPMDHPVYDVWVLDCLETAEAQAQKQEAKPSANPDIKTADEAVETVVDSEAQTADSPEEPAAAR